MEFVQSYKLMSVNNVILVANYLQESVCKTGKHA